MEWLDQVPGSSQLRKPEEASWRRWPGTEFESAVYKVEKTNFSVHPRPAESVTGMAQESVLPPPLGDSCARSHLRSISLVLGREFGLFPRNLWEAGKVLSLGMI